MTAANQNESRLNAAVTAIMDETLDDSAIARVTQQALCLHKQNRKPVARVLASAVSRLTQRWVSLAACVVVALMVVTWSFSNSASSAFAQVVEHAMQIRNVQFVRTVQIYNDPETVGKVLMQGDMVRSEFGPEQNRFVAILNSATKKILYLDPSRKVVQYSEKRSNSGPVLINPIARLAAAKRRSIRSLGHDRIAGREVDVYRVRGLRAWGVGPETEMTLWADSVTHLPVKIEMKATDPKHKMSLSFDQFEWNVNLSDELFAMTVPDGFKSGSIVKDISESKRKLQPSKYGQDFAGGVLFSGRVPSRLAVDRERETVTALLRDPEKQQGAMNRSPIELRQWDASTGQERWVKSVGGAGDFAICSSKNLLATVEGQEIQLRQLSTGTIVSTWESDEILGTVAISHDGTQLAHGYIRWSHPPGSKPPSGGVEIWNIKTGKLEHHIRDIECVDYLEFSPTSDLLVVCSGAWKTRLYNAATGVLEHSMKSGSRAAFSPDGKLLATISSQLPSDRTQCRVDLVDVASKKTLRSLISSGGKEDSWLLSLAFSHDGERLAAANWNGSVTVWNVASGDITQNIGPLPNGVHSVRFVSPNQLATGCEDEMLRLHPLTE